MPMKFKRKLYPRGGSYETTIPLPILFSLDPEKKHDVMFEYDPKSSRWYIGFKERRNKKTKEIKKS
jgi:hypothetical protein